MDLIISILRFMASRIAGPGGLPCMLFTPTMVLLTPSSYTIAFFAKANYGTVAGWDENGFLLGTDVCSK